MKLFICLFTMKNGVKEEEGEGESGRHHEGEEKGRRPQQRAMMSSCKDRRLQQLLSHNYPTCVLMGINPEFVGDLCASLWYLAAFLQTPHELELFHQRRHGYRYPLIMRTR